jgi:hypothetical protein
MHFPVRKDVVFCITQANPAGARLTMAVQMIHCGAMKAKIVVPDGDQACPQKLPRMIVSLLLI